MSHLGDRIAALVDGELSHDARDRTLAHLACCAECRAEAEAERETKSQLGKLEVPAPSAELMSKLLMLGEPGPPMPPSRRSFPGGGRPAIPTAPAPGRPASMPAARRRPGTRTTRRLRIATVGALSGFAIVMGTAFAVGGTPEEPGSPLTPPVDSYSVEHAATSDEMPLTTPAFATYTGWYQLGATTNGYGLSGYPPSSASVLGVPSR